MAKFKQVLFMGLSVVLVAALAVAGTLAYLTSTDADVNVMTLGNVEIEQIEQERDENGNLVDFTQAKPLYPAVGDVAWNDNKVNINGHDYNMFGEKLKNSVDKIVSVKNTGKSDAYVRTWIALEDPFTTAMIGVNVGGTGYTESSWMTAEIDGVTYSVTCFTYNKALKPNEVSLPSFLQVYLKSTATNEDVALLGDTYDILAFSQAVQTAGFDDAVTALNEAFGEPKAENLPWANGVVIPTVVSDAEAFVEAVNDGGAIVLNEDITITDTLNITKKTNIDLNGHELTVSVLEAKEDTTIDNGTIVHGKSTYPALSVSNGELTLNEVKIVCEEPCNVITNVTGTLFVAEYSGLEVWSGKCTLNDSTITVKCTEKRYGNSLFAVGIHGGEFTMNGGAITVESVGSHQAKYNYEGIIFAGSASDKVVNLNNVTTKYSDGTVGADFLFAWGGNTVINTTDASVVANADVNERNGGTYTFNQK